MTNSPSFRLVIVGTEVIVSNISMNVTVLESAVPISGQFNTVVTVRFDESVDDGGSDGVQSIRYLGMYIMDSGYGIILVLSRPVLMGCSFCPSVVCLIMTSSSYDCGHMKVGTRKVSVSSSYFIKCARHFSCIA